ncbi:hypothetical protein HYALB_00008132 [Hymenoscyphus albidus]|uniref:SH3 domain-containing protein n=1 Tax=Hymenoscyphus albidus TaxID=595503 RepID=A0A9N9LGF0_9HELO|nr:hypothetical protein HYALB_00008132 [Hymenoscyphus albidus]
MAIPQRFPCWCRAVYSFGGESKRDLGFVEGDLIECLNAGDGSWWMGRLRRDKRMMGLFPSNFVEVLDESFRPTSRSSSPMPDRSPSPNPFNPPPQKSKSKAFRKPFTAYAAPDPALAKRAELRKKQSVVQASSPHTRTQSTPTTRTYNPRAVSPVPPSHRHAYHHSYGSRVPSPATPIQHNSYGSRTHSPAPPPQQYNSYGSYNSRTSKAPSPAPPQTYNSYGSRAPSPVPSFQYKAYSREPSPPENELGSSPPPPPPPHRTTFTPHGSANTHQQHPATLHTPHAASPCPPSPGGTGLTPSPLRSAMDDVMSSLYDMGASRHTEPPEQPLDPWSPEAFDQTYITERNKVARPLTSMGIGRYEDEDPRFKHVRQRERGSSVADQPPPQLSNYVRRMENRLSKMHARSSQLPRDDSPPVVPPKMNGYDRPPSAAADRPKLHHRKSAYEVGKSMLGRTFTTKTNSTDSSSASRSTNTSSSTQMTDRSIMSGPSASGFSSTSAGSYARKKEALYGRSRSAFGSRKDDFSASQVSVNRPESPFTGVSYHNSHASGPARPQSQVGWQGATNDTPNVLGGLTAPRPKKSGFFKKMIESAKTGAASARSSIAVGDSSRPGTSSRNRMPNGVTSIAGGYGNSQHSSSAANDMGLGSGNGSGGGGIDWVQVRRDVNRSNSLSQIEHVERKERCQMMDHPAISPVEELLEGCDGDEGVDGNPVAEPTDFQAVNLSLVDKNARFINSLPPMTNPVSLATGFVCRPYRSDVQRLRAIFTWVSEKIIWEDEYDSAVESRKVISTKRGGSEEVAVLVLEMCAAVGIQAEVVRGYLKTPGEVPELTIMPRPNHWWNAVAVDGEWRFMDCSLASPSNPRRALYSSTGSQQAESWWFLARPTEICWTHVPELHQQQHLCPPIAHEVLLALPCACPPYFKNALQMVDYDTSLVRVEDLELVHIKFTVPADIECVAEVEARAFEKDADGDFFESGETVKKRALAQAEWIGGEKRYTVKALLPGDEGQGILRVYAGKRGLMHSIKDIPHPLAFALPIIHSGDNPPYGFLTRHPTPHAQRHDLYVAQPQCERLALNNTFVFAVRQHPSSTAISSPNPGNVSPVPFIRPSSAMSISNSSASGSNPSTSAYGSKKPAKLAIQSPGGKVLRLMRKDDKIQSTSLAVEKGDGGTWETIIKVGERGVWRGLVLADRSARWCVFAEWTCV